MLTLLACKKKDQLLGKELLGPDALLNGISTDTFYLATSVVLESPTMRPMWCWEVTTIRSLERLMPPFTPSLGWLE